MKKLDSIIISVSVFPTFVFLTSCGSSLMVPAAQIAEAPAEKALVIFVRTTSYGGANEFEVWDGENFVGVIDPKSYIQYEATPGKHIFLGCTDDWSFIKANLEAGKRYFIIGHVSPGITEIKQVFRPVHKPDADYNESDFHEWLTNFKPTSLDPSKGDEYAPTRVRFVKSAIENFKPTPTNLDMLEPDEWY